MAERYVRRALKLKVSSSSPTGDSGCPYAGCTAIGKKTSGCVDYRITIIYVYPKNTAVVVFGYILGPRHPAVVQVGVGLPRVAGGAAVHLQDCPQGCPRPSQDPS